MKFEPELAPEPEETGTVNFQVPKEFKNRLAKLSERCAKARPKVKYAATALKYLTLFANELEDYFKTAAKSTTKGPGKTTDEVPTFTNGQMNS